MFNGLSIIRKDKPFSSEDTRPSKRAQAWELYEKGRIDAAYSNWVVSGSIHQPELLYFVFKILNENDVEFIRAPYLAWGQVRFIFQSSSSSLPSPSSLSPSSSSISLSNIIYKDKLCNNW